MSKITYKNIPNFGDINKSEERKKEETMMAWVGMTDVNDLEPKDREAFMQAIHGNKALDFFRQNLDQGEREELFCEKLNNLKSWLNHNGLNKYSYHINNILKEIISR